MKISIITVFPEIFEPFLNTSLVKRAIDQRLIEIQLIKFSQLCPPKERIDEATAGPGSGMIIKPALIEAGIAQAEKNWGKGFKIFFTPQGKRLDQQVLHKLKAKIFVGTSLKQSDQIPDDKDLKIKILNNTQLDAITNSVIPDSGATSSNPFSSEQAHLIIVSTRYEGIDARAEATFADEIISIGDYVLMGGDLPAQVFLEAFLRLIPGIVGSQESVDHESFSGALLDHPQYGQTITWQEQTVPEIVKSGNHLAIANWRQEEACKKTLLKRFDWFRKHKPTPAELTLAQKIIPNHYVVLMHTDILLKSGAVGTSSVASLDIHDIARSSATFGLKGYFLVTKLEDQAQLVNTFLDFWKSDDGKEYNKNRYQAMHRVQTASSIDEVIDKITQIENAAPLMVATCAKKQQLQTPQIDYHSQGTVWAHNRPVLFIFGTAHGLSQSIIERCDYLLLPVNGMTSYNHLSVRSAAAVIFDRWFGLNEKL
jgi:tRNA (guanine37-N1)-methyltransferase